MNRIAAVGVTLCVAVGVGGCGAPDSTGPGQAPDGKVMAAPLTQPLAATSNGPRPVKGQIEGSDQYGEACGEGQGVVIVSTGSGTISHFGTAVMVSTSCVNLSDFSVIGPTPFSITGANGDQVSGFLTDFVFTAYGFDLYTSITAGTGRFAGATGALVFPTVSTGSGVWSSGVEGWIAY
jgi:hypothetical protein